MYGYFLVLAEYTWVEPPQYNSGEVRRLHPGREITCWISWANHKKAALADSIVFSLKAQVCIWLIIQTMKQRSGIENEFRHPEVQLSLLSANRPVTYLLSWINIGFLTSGIGSFTQMATASAGYNGVPEWVMWPHLDVLRSRTPGKTHQSQIATSPAVPGGEKWFPKLRLSGESRQVSLG